MPIHFEPPSCRPFCAASRSASAFISASNPPIASISARSSGGQVALGEPAQPVRRQVEPRDDRLRGVSVSSAGEDRGEHAVEAVEVALVLHQRGAGEVVEALDVVADEAEVEGGEQVEVLAQRHRHPSRAQRGEEGREHLRSARSARPRRVATSVTSTKRMPWTAAYWSMSSRSPPRAAARRQPKSAPRTKARRSSIAVSSGSRGASAPRAAPARARGRRRRRRSHSGPSAGCRGAPPAPPRPRPAPRAPRP